MILDVLVPVLVALAGGLGAAARLVVDGMVRTRWPRTFPVATLVVNVTGSAVLGLLLGGHLAGVVPTPVLLVAGVGFCGGYTTFSTAMVETVRLAQDGDAARAVGNVLASFALCLAVAAAATALAAAAWG
ncbi:chromosome condensation protein CrcB [Actinotalea ferrariae CF5-4]|uniref:Fluoride-specific ion channel FluC n=1 Tax=Actinotalea ferrariae CF5-4 TaxID=948458 RepID=A0A021VKU3_9CELL|nr:CrcB family protein [Actinotalea ferrariae]EYR61834.1 chromosome condensation protein CrcB [Actinotalea ferrariae CF5-4]